MPLEAHIKEHPVYFKRFDVAWTPTVIIIDPDGVERFRIDGYLPKDECRQLELGLPRVALTAKDWDDAERRYAEVLDRYSSKRRPKRCTGKA